MDQVQCRGILEVMKDSLEDRPQQRDMTEAEVRYKLIIDPSEDDSLVRLLFSFGVLQRTQTRMFVCSDFPGDSQVQKVREASENCTKYYPERESSQQISLGNQLGVEPRLPVRCSYQ